MSYKIQIRRDTTTNWEATNPILSDGEVGYDKTLKKIKIGNGSTAWNTLEWYAAGLSEENVQKLSDLSGINTGDQDLSGLLPKNVAITGATKTKITFDANGLVTSGTDATTADIDASTDKNYVTDNEKSAITHTNKTDLDLVAGTNTGDQDLSGLLPKNVAIIGATKTKITFDANGLVTGGEDATTADIEASANRNYITDDMLTNVSNLFGTNTGDQDLSGYLLKNNTEVIVSTGGGGDFSSIKNAINGITDASASKPYLIKVKPGIYMEDPFSLKPYVIVVGDGLITHITIVTTDQNNHFITGSNYSAIANCAISGPSGIGKAAVYHAVNSPIPLILKDVTITGGYYGVWCDPQTSRGLVHCINVINMYNGTSIEKFFYSTGYGTITGINSGYMCGVSNKCQVGFCTEGTHAEMTLDNCFFKNSGSSIQNTAMHLDNGANVRTSGFTIASAYNGIVCGNYGVGSKLVSIGTIINDNVVNHIHTMGAGDNIEYTGKANKNKISTQSGDTFSAVFSDVTPGEEGQVVLGELWLGTPGSSVPIRDYGLHTYSTGCVDGGETTKDNSIALRVSVASGQGYINNGASVKLVKWDTGYIDVADNVSGQIIYVDNGGNINVATQEVNYQTNIILASIETGHGVITFIADHRIMISQFIPSIAEYLEEVIGPISTGGGIVTINPDPYGSKQLCVTGGSFYIFHTPNTFEGGYPVVLHTNYRDGSGGWIHTTNVTDVDTGYYDDGSGTLQTVPSNKWVKDILYLLKTPTAEYYHYVYGQELFDSQQLAEVGNNPVPPTHMKYALRLAGIVSQGESDHINSIVDQRPRLGQSASGSTAVTDHGELTGLNDDDHSIYYNQTRGDARYRQLGDISSTDIALAKIGNPTMVRDLDDFFQYGWSAGVILGGDIIDNNNGTIDISEGETLLRASAIGTGELKSMTFPASTGIALINNATNYIYVDYNGGNAVIQHTTTSTDFNCWNKCHLYTIIREDNLLSILEGRHQNIDSNRNTRRKAYETEGFKHVNGGSVLGNIGLHITVSSGAFYYALNRLPHPSFDTSVAGTAITNVFECYFTTSTPGVWGHDFELKELTTDMYDDGNGNMVALTNGYYSTHWIYLILDSNTPRLACIHGRGNYATILEAQNEGVPSILPPAIAGAGALLGRICFVKNATSYAIIESAFSATFNAAGGTQWGGIAGAITNQADLSEILGGKLAANTAITPSTKTKITYDANGLVTSGTDATTADIADSTDKRYVSDVLHTAITHTNRTALDNVSGINTGDQTSVSGSAGSLASQYIDWDASSGGDSIKNKPIIPAAQVKSDWNASGTVAEILNKPIIPAAQVNSDWNSASGVTQIVNKPILGTAADKNVPATGNASNTEVVLGADTRLTNSRTPSTHASTHVTGGSDVIPNAVASISDGFMSGTDKTKLDGIASGAEVNVKSDWNASGTVAEILNKPIIPAAQVKSDWNASGTVAEILNKPTIPAAQVNSDWNSASGLSQILNKPYVPDFTGNVSIIANTGAISTTETIVIKTPALPANRLTAGQVIRIVLEGTATAGNVSAPTWRVRLGTTGTTADAVMLTASSGDQAATGTNIPFRAEITLIVRTTGASATCVGKLAIQNNGITGIQRSAYNQVVTLTPSTFNTTTANLILSTTFRSGNGNNSANFNIAYIEFIAK